MQYFHPCKIILIWLLLALCVWALGGCGLPPDMSVSKLEVQQQQSAIQSIQAHIIRRLSQPTFLRTMCKKMMIQTTRVQHTQALCLALVNQCQTLLEHALKQAKQRQWIMDVRRCHVPLKDVFLCLDTSFDFVQSQAEQVSCRTSNQATESTVGQMKDSIRSRCTKTLQMCSSTQSPFGDLFVRMF